LDIITGGYLDPRGDEKSAQRGARQPSFLETVTDMLSRTEANDQMTAVIERVEQARRESRHRDLSDLGDVRLAGIVSMLSIAIYRYAMPGSTFRDECDAVRKECGSGGHHLSWPVLAGILLALRDAYQNGYLEEVHELIHADVFTDFLEMAQHLLEEGYKDPSAVLVGGVLEEHLRKLCTKNGIAITNPTDSKARKADGLNNDLAKAGAYDKLAQKNVTAWLDLRNKAAHAEYNTYDANQVDYRLRGLRDFLTRYRA
jgi:hypothetical protein